MIWMHICKVMQFFVVTDSFGTLLLVSELNFQAVIKSAASAAFPKTKFRNPREQIAVLRSPHAEPLSVASPEFLDFDFP